MSLSKTVMKNMRPVTVLTQSIKLVKAVFITRDSLQLLIPVNQRRDCCSLALVLIKNTLSLSLSL